MSPAPGFRDQRSRLMSERSTWSERGMRSLKMTIAARTSDGSAVLGLSALWSTSDSNCAGANRRNAASIGSTSSSWPDRMWTCVRSAASGGLNFIRPRPSSTIAVGPSGVAAMNARPDDTSTFRSGARTTRLLTSYSVAVSRARRYRPVITDKRLTAAIRHGSPGVSPVFASTRQVPSRPSIPRSVKISTTSRSTPASRGARSRSVTTTRLGGGEVSVAAKSSKLGRLICGSPSARIAARSPAATAC